MTLLRIFPLSAGLGLSLAVQAQAQAAAESATAVPACALNQPEPALPLRTRGTQIVDANGKNFKLSGVAWYGAESQDFVVGGLQLEPLDAIARRIRCLGFNAVRLPWSNELYESNPKVPDYTVTANPQLKGLHALAVYTAVVHALAKQGLMVILDNHTSNAQWCCGNDGNTLWYNNDYPESSWIADWRGMAARFRSVPQVIAADLRNEPRIDATWGGSATTDWHGAAERGGAAVLATNKNLLIMVEGINYSLDLTGVAALPVTLPVAEKLVYSPHDYPFDHSNFASAADLAAQYDKAWGYIVTPDQPYTAPIWLGEFGNCHTASACVTDTAANSSGLWFAGIRQYIQQRGISWSWWAINGTQTTGAGRTFGAEESYGVLNPYWNAPALPNEFNPTDNVADALQTTAQPAPAQGGPAGAPLIAIASPVPGDTIASGTTLTLAVDANVVAGGTDAIANVQIYVDGRLAGRATGTQSPYSFAWINVPPGAHLVQAQAVTRQGLLARSQAIPVQATNYVASRAAYTDGIGIDFVSYAVTPMGASEMAGVVPQPHWNQAGVANNGTLPGLLDANGTATTASVSWTSPNTYFTAIPDQAGDNRLMKGYLDNSDSVPNTVSVAGLPKNFATYDVVAYFDGGNEGSGGTAGPKRSASFRLTSSDSSGVHGCQGQGQEGSTVTGTDEGGVDFSGTFLQAANGSGGNYVLFLNCTGSSFQLAPVHGPSTNSEVRAPITGCRFWRIPETARSLASEGAALCGPSLHHGVESRVGGERRCSACLADVPVRDGGFSFRFDADSLYSLTTTTGQGRGSAEPPAAGPFPFPWQTDWAKVRLHGTPPYLSDQDGAFEVNVCQGRPGRCLEQVITTKPIPWGPRPDPWTLAGDARWTDYAVRVNAHMTGQGSTMLLGRIDSADVFADQKAEYPSGYLFRVDAEGRWTLLSAASKRPTRSLAHGTLPGGAAWRKLELSFHGRQIEARLDGKVVATVEDDAHTHGMMGVGTGWNRTQFEDLSVATR